MGLPIPLASVFSAVSGWDTAISVSVKRQIAAKSAAVKKYTLRQLREKSIMRKVMKKRVLSLLLALLMVVLLVPTMSFADDAIRAWFQDTISTVKNLLDKLFGKN